MSAGIARGGGDYVTPFRTDFGYYRGKTVLKVLRALHENGERKQ